MPLFLDRSEHSVIVRGKGRNSVNLKLFRNGVQVDAEPRQRF
jgi:hypothetical protein